MVTFYALSVQFSVLVSCHVIENQEFGFIKGSNLVRRVVSPSLDSNWNITCLEPLLSSRVVATLERMFVCLDLTVTKVNIKVQKQENN